MPMDSAGRGRVPGRSAGVGQGAFRRRDLRDGAGWCPLDRWSETTGLVDLGLPAGSSQRTHGRDISADGSVIVGSSKVLGTPARAFRWTEATRRRRSDLHGSLPESSMSGANAGSADRSTAVGSVMDTITGARSAIVWNESGTVLLGRGRQLQRHRRSGHCARARLRVGTGDGDAQPRDHLVEDHFVDVTGMVLGAATDVSNDGLSILASELARVTRGPACWIRLPHHHRPHGVQQRHRRRRCRCDRSSRRFRMRRSGRSVRETTVPWTRCRDRAALTIIGAMARRRRA